MKISLDWLKDYFAGKMGDVSPEEITYILSRQGIGVDYVHRQDKGLEQVVLARLIEVKKHPNADRLTACKVDIGGGQIRSIVCGAKNHKQNDFVLVALPGANLPNGLFIKETNLRGVLSQGMICSREELGLVAPAEKSEEGVITFSEQKLPLGAHAAQVLGRDDVVFELDITPNRGDCLSVIGVARELAAGLKRQLNLPDPDFKTHEQHRAEQEVGLKLLAEEECPYFTLQVIEDVKVGPSPDWLRRRIEAVGLRSVNNIVDVTNFVMLETGQPLHAYDLDAVTSASFIVRRAKAGTKFKALNGETYELNNTDLVIADGERVLGLAGVMGGEESQITGKTKRIALEAAFFNPVVVRKTARRLALHSDSSHRFERTVNPMGVTFASQRAVQLIQKVAGGTVLGGLMKAGAPPYKPRTMNVDLRRFNKVIGLDISAEVATELLKRLEIQVESKSSNVLKVTPPPFRNDLQREVDILEEIARMMGYDQIPGTLPVVHTGNWTRETGGNFFATQFLKREASRLGFYESVSYAFVSEKLNRFFRNPLLAEEPRGIRLQNPISEDMAVLRFSGAVGLLQNLSRNERFGFSDVQLFESGSIFTASQRAYPQTFRPGAEKRVDQRGVFEAQTLTFLMAGRDLVEPSAELWNKDARPLDFFDLKGKLETLLQSTKVKVEWRAPKTPISFLHPAQQAELVLYRDVVGWAGAVHPDVLRAFDIRTDEAWVAEFLVEPILAQIPKVRFKFDFPSPYQRVERDAAFIVDRRVTAAQAVESLRKVKLETLKDAYIFDVYEGQGIESGKKSIALRFIFQSHERTLTEEEINQAFHQCIDSIRQQCQAELRGSV